MLLVLLRFALATGHLASCCDLSRQRDLLREAGRRNGFVKRGATSDPLTTLQNLMIEEFSNFSPGRIR